MAQVGRQHRQPGLDVDSVVVPLLQRDAREPVAQVLHAGPAVVRAGCQPGLADQPAESAKSLIFTSNRRQRGTCCSNWLYALATYL
jgi:hypothetical protein